MLMYNVEGLVVEPQLHERCKALVSGIAYLFLLFVDVKILLRRNEVRSAYPAIWL